MQAHDSFMLSFLAYKLASILSGTFICWMGFKLFVKGFHGPSGDIDATFSGGNRIYIKKIAPGSFFSLLGAAVIGVTLYKGLEVETSGSNSQPTSETGSSITLPKQLP
ncbi:hypothetical protein ACUN9Y_19695 [Halomonas sp. V046]|uniref:hypothetical protein n=1 Tax=Halomonas sp. V046 TaxID=3459611 RepID=UPI004043C137